MAQLTFGDPTKLDPAPGFEVTEATLGVYRPEEHIDNPLGNEDGRNIDPDLPGPGLPEFNVVDITMARKLRKVQGTEKYLPYYVLIRGLDLRQGLTTEEIEDVKKTFPALRIVLLMREPGDKDPCPEFLLLDIDLLPDLQVIFEDSAT